MKVHPNSFDDSNAPLCPKSCRAICDLTQEALERLEGKRQRAQRLYTNGKRRHTGSPPKKNPYGYRDEIPYNRTTLQIQSLELDLEKLERYEEIAQAMIPPRSSGKYCTSQETGGFLLDHADAARGRQEYHVARRCITDILSFLRKREQGKDYSGQIIHTARKVSKLLSNENLYQHFENQGFESCFLDYIMYNLSAGKLPRKFEPYTNRF